MPTRKQILVVVGSLGTLGILAFWVEPARAQSAADISRQVINDAIQSNLQSIRDRLQSRPVLTPGYGQPMRFTNEGNPNQEYFDDVFGALGYAKSPTATKAPSMPAMPAPPPPPQWAVWATGSGDWQRSTVAGITSKASTGAGVGGIDWTKTGIFTSSDALVIGVDGAGSFTHVDTGSKVTTPAVGAYIAYINGGFSADFSFLAAFSDTDLGTVSPGIGSTIRTDAYSYTGDLNYRFDIPYAWWIEPTVGVTYANTFFVNEPGAATGEILTWQGGARVGTEWVLANGVKVQPTFTGLAYSNTTEKAGGLPGAPTFVPLPPGVGGIAGGTAAGTDRGQVWGKGQAKFNFVFNSQFSAYVQGVIRGTNGTLDALGGGVEVGARYVF
jgi:hypothetical protein